MSNYEKINLEDYTQTGEGGQALTYTRKDGNAMAKMFIYEQGLDTVEREFYIFKAVYEAGIPSPKTCLHGVCGRYRLAEQRGDSFFSEVGYSGRSTPGSLLLWCTTGAGNNSSAQEGRCPRCSLRRKNSWSEDSEKNVKCENYG
ncbi:MAG: hypothetical protein IJ753_05765 [Bacteroidales bacterium]|nr:hypothetical protein [Bacteroidales bacterium]